MEYLLPSFCPFLGGSSGGKETAVFNDPLPGGTGGGAVLRAIDGLPADVDLTDEVSSAKCLTN